MLTVSSGHSASYLTDAVALGRENYYSGAVAAGEPPGRWYGEGATSLGLIGLVAAQDMTAVFERLIDPRDPAFRNPECWNEAATLGRARRRYITEAELYKAALDVEPDATPERRAELLLDAGKRARRNVAFHDVTFSVQKSITVLHTAFEAQEVAARRAGNDTAAAAWAQHRKAVEDAIWAGNNVALDYLAKKAGYSRIGHHGGAAGRFIDAHQLVIASFFQHDSRDHDPQLHIHNAILNRVEGSDGEWRTLDSRGLYRYRGAAGAIAERTTETHLARSLGLRFATRPDGKAREIVGVRPEVMALFSSRRRAITAATEDRVAAFTARFDREPNALELDRLRRQATFATRRAKSHTGESAEERLDRWDRELRTEVAAGLAGVATDVLGLAADSVAGQPWTRSAVVEAALADVQSRKAAWTAPDLTRAVSDALPDHLGALSGAEITELLERLTQEAISLAVPLDADRPGAATAPPALQLADGRSAYATPGGSLYATPAHMHTERLLVSSSHATDGPALPREVARAFVGSLRELGLELAVDQAAAVNGILTSGARIETLVGPAGTGKSFVLGVLAKAWTAPEHWDGDSRAVAGLASSQIATEILAGEGIAAQNIARWLGTQQRLDRADANATAPQPHDQAWRLRPGDLVVIDESAMTATADIGAVYDYVQRAGAKLLLTGDHRQLASVGAGGAMALVAAAGPTRELTEARRFTAPWEAEACLGLRVGDAEALNTYRKHGRLLDCGTAQSAEASAARSWLADTLDGRRSILVVATNEQAAELSAQMRAELVRLKRVQERGAPLDLQGTTAGVGDLVQARANAWNLAGHAGNRRGPINRELLRVTAVLEDGGLVVTTPAGQGEISTESMTLPPEYVRHHLALGYATTAHAAQGLTVDTAHVVVTSSTSAPSLYVGLSRGRHVNTAHVATLLARPDAPAKAPGVLRRSPVAVLAVAFENSRTDRSALEEAAQSMASTNSLRAVVELFSDAASVATAGRVTGWLDRLVSEGHLRGSQREQLAAEDGATSLTRLLRRVELAGHEPFEALRTAVTARHLEDARQLTNVLHHRITAAVSLDPRGERFSDWTPRVADASWGLHLHELAARADGLAAELGQRSLEAPPPWALEALGPPPDRAPERHDWARRAGIIAAHREITDHDDATVALGAPPAPGQPELFASWRAACRAVGREEAAREEAEMSNGQLRLRVRAWDREQAWAPAYVADELEATCEAAAAHRAAATLLQAHADATSVASERERLRGEAGDSAALARALDARAQALVEADRVRALWYAHTAATRLAGERAADELDRRRVDSTVEESPVTAEEWLESQRRAVEIEDKDRVVRVTSDFAEAAEGAYLAHEVFAARPPGGVLEDAPSPIEPLGPLENAPGAQALAKNLVRVPGAEETATILAEARAALATIAQRESLEREREAAEELARHQAAAHQSRTAQPPMQELADGRRTDDASGCTG